MTKLMFHNVSYIGFKYVFFSLEKILQVFRNKVNSTIFKSRMKYYGFKYKYIY